MRFEVLPGWKDNKELISAIQSNDREYPLYREFLNELEELARDFVDDTITAEQIKDWFNLLVTRVLCAPVERTTDADIVAHEEMLVWLTDVRVVPLSFVLPGTRVKIKNQHNAIRWNAPDEKGHPLLTENCTDHPSVHRVSYELVANLLETSGCSKEEPYWIHSVIGGLHTSRGVQLICPGDWIVEPLEGVYLVLTHDQYLALYGAKAQAA